MTPIATHGEVGTVHARHVKHVSSECEVICLGTHIAALVVLVGKALVEGILVLVKALDAVTQFLIVKVDARLQKHIENTSLIEWNLSYDVCSRWIAVAQSIFTHSHVLFEGTTPGPHFGNFLRNGAAPTVPAGRSIGPWLHLLQYVSQFPWFPWRLRMVWQPATNYLD